MEAKEKEMIFGLRPVIEALEAGKEIEKVLVQNGLNGALASDLKKKLLTDKIPFQFVPAEKLNRLTRGNHQGVICFISPIEYGNIETILPGIFETGKAPLLLILDRITDVRNFGAIARTAECAGVDAILIPEHGGARISGDAVKTSAGALHKIHVCREKNMKTAIAFLRESGVQVVACTEKGSQAYHQMDFSGPIAFIMGSEEDGISPAYLENSDVKVSIPLSGEIKSLNVSVACGVILFEALRQRVVA